MTELEKIIQVLKNLGGKAEYAQIHKEYERITGISVDAVKSATIRNTIETHSSDSDRFNGKEDVFYSVYGKGKGVWGLRN